MKVGRSRLRRWVVGGCAIVLIASACTFGDDTTSEDDAVSGSAGDGAVTLTMWAHRSKSFNQALRDSAAA